MKMTEIQKSFVQVLISLKKTLGLDEADIIGITVMCCTERMMEEMVLYIEEEWEQNTLTRDKMVAKVHEIIQNQS